MKTKECLCGISRADTLIEWFLKMKEIEGNKYEN